MHYVYLIKSQKTSQIYVGCTSDLRRRFQEHNNDLTPSTRGKSPWELIYYEAYSNEKDAHERERMLKHHGTSIGHLKKRLEHSLGKE